MSAETWVKFCAYVVGDTDRARLAPTGTATPPDDSGFMDFLGAVAGGLT